MTTRTVRTPGKYSRRRFLGAIGAGLGLLPLLEADGLGATGAAPRRLLLVMQPNGLHHGLWVNGVPADWLPRTSSGDLAKATFPTITKPLERHKERLSIYQLDLSNVLEHKGKFGGHEAYAAVFSGGPGSTAGTPFPGKPFYPVGPTIDQFVGDALVKRAPHLVRGLPLAALTDADRGLHAGNYRAFWRGENQPVTPEHSPYKAADGLFSGGPAMTEDPRLVRLRAERKTILDVLAPDLERYMKNLGSEDRQRVAGHLDAVQELQRQLLGPGGKGAPAACGAPADKPIDFMANANFPAVVDAHFKLVKIAFACDVTRVATVQLGNSHGNGMVFPWLGIEGAGLDPLGTKTARAFHDIAHVPTRGGKNEKAIVDGWFMTKLAELVDLFAGTAEGTGTLLDASAIVWANHMEDGGGHLLTAVPFFVAGGCGGYLRTGRLFGGPHGTKSGSVNGLLVGLCNAMECPVGFYGDERFGGELPGLRRV